MIDEYELRFDRVHGRLELFELAAADQETRIHAAQMGAHLTGYFGARRERERLKFALVFSERGRSDADVQQQRALATAGPFKQDGHADGHAIHRAARQTLVREIE